LSSTLGKPYGSDVNVSVSVPPIEPNAETVLVVADHLARDMRPGHETVLFLDDGRGSRIVHVPLAHPVSVPAAWGSFADAGAAVGHCLCSQG
jgi:hypothetical protein